MSEENKLERSSYICIIICLICAVSVGVFFDHLAEEPKLRKIDEKRWGNKNDSRIRPFSIKFQKHEILDLEERLLNARNITKSVPLTEFTNGINSIFLQKIVDYWLYKYDWKERETHFNRYPQYKTTIQGLDIHFLHIIPTTNKTKLPILLIHGFPGTFLEFYEVISHLIEENENFNLELVIPTLPGYLFSDSHTYANFGGVQHAIILKNLMLELGFEKFFVFGHDLGSIIATDMAVIFPKKVLGLYSPTCSSLRRISLLKMGIEDIYQMLRGSKSITLNYLDRMWNEGAYYHSQTTLPDVIGISINDSPIGLAAYFLYIFASGANEKYYLNTWDGGISKNYDYKNILDVLTLYWFSKSIPTSMRTFKDISVNSYRTYQIPVNKEVPCSCPMLEKELFHFSNWILGDKYKTLLRRNTKIKAGHFLLLEKNKEVKRIIGNDIKESIREMILYHEQRKRFLIK